MVGALHSNVGLKLLAGVAFASCFGLGRAVSVPEALCMAAWERRAREVVVFCVIFRSLFLLGGNFGGLAGGGEKAKVAKAERARQGKRGGANNATEQWVIAWAVAR